jgi:hypothetical protein
LKNKAIAQSWIYAIPAMITLSTIGGVSIGVLALFIGSLLILFSVVFFAVKMKIKEAITTLAVGAPTVVLNFALGATLMTMTND